MRKAKQANRTAKAARTNGHTLKLPTLAVEIVSRTTGKVLRTVEMRDPRIGFCREYNELNEADGRTARPVTRKTKGGAA